MATATRNVDSYSAAEFYLDLLVGCLSRTVIPEYFAPIEAPSKAVFRPIFSFLKSALGLKGIVMVRRYQVDPAKRESGHDWPPDAETMIGLKRLANLRFCVRTVIEDNIPGDFIETGVWRGGACILMRGALKAYGDHSRCVWLADSFEGLPKPNAEKYAADAGDIHWTNNKYLAVSLERVKANFARYGLLDDRVKFLQGWFSETLPGAPIQQLAILRIDGDMYESTIDAMSSLYDKLSAGGFVIVDDYHLEGCKRAITDFRREREIQDLIVDIDGCGVYWRKEDQTRAVHE